MRLLLIWRSNMRLSDVLSNKPKIMFEPIEGFLDGKSLGRGKIKKIDIGNIRMDFFCEKCNKMQQFCLYNPIKPCSVHCIGINEKIISIDCALSCLFCNTSIPIWFLVESENDIHSLTPKVRIMKYSDKLLENVSYSQLSKYRELFDAADKAYREGLGAGSIIYLRKIYETIVGEVVKKYHIDNDLNFKEKLKQANNKAHIIPQGLDDRKYELFQELSNVIHGEFDDNKALDKYIALKELINSIVENIQTADRLKTLRRTLNL